MQWLLYFYCGRVFTTEARGVRGVFLLFFSAPSEGSDARAGLTIFEIEQPLLQTLTMQKWLILTAHRLRQTHHVISLYIEQGIAFSKSSPASCRPFSATTVDQNEFICLHNCANPWSPIIFLCSMASNAVCDVWTACPSATTAG